MKPLNEKVVSLHGDPVPQLGKVNESTVEFLADLLAKAQSGEIQGFAGAVVNSQREASFYVIGTVGGYSMVGALQCAHSRLTEIARGE